MRHDIEHLQTALSAYPRIALLEGATPIQKLSRLSALPTMRGCNLYVKRDDLTGLGGGGNKLRKLEFLLGEAIAGGADTLVTWGGLQSNHARLTAAVAARHGLACELILTHSPIRDDNDYRLNGNVLLDTLFGASVHQLPVGAAAETFALELVERLQRQGRKTFVMPLGGTSRRGSLGYAACAAEVLGQADTLGLQFERIIIPNGSSGTHSGLLAGLSIAGSSTQVQGYSVLGTAGPTLDVTREKTQAVLKLLGSITELPAEALHIDDSQRGSAYGAPTASMLAATRTLASQEGLLIDPVYGGKAFAGLLESVARGDHPAGSNLLFIMTGGLPGIFAYRTAYS
jgi:D-cysteine desulfhydrase